jgi:Fe-S oxidoreductase
MSKLKAEYLYQTQKKGFLINWPIKYFGNILKIGSKFPKFYNYIQNTFLVRKVTGIQKSLPNCSNQSLDVWWRKSNNNDNNSNAVTVFVICDPYTQYYDVESGKDFLKFLQLCNVNINVIFSKHSIRALISNGFLDNAKRVIDKITRQLKSASTNDIITGIEVSDVLAWRDDVKSLVNDKPPKILLFEELVMTLDRSNLLPKINGLNSKVWIYTHCHQKALSDSDIMKQALSLVPNIDVEEIQGGCCGMAGDFGYKYPKLSKKIAHQSLGGVMKEVGNNDIIVATGSSCRVQFSDIFQKKSIHLSQLFTKAIKYENFRR